ncbi:hypothetical protein [Pseudonocardia zijingensis]|uniref:hypothetical protein n=1 Tax=Pseudonocardia zijingensis TaxID=153376 RepID=UPI0031D90FA9
MARAAVPDWRARPFPTSPSPPGAYATVLWSRPTPINIPETGLPPRRVRGTRLPRIFTEAVPDGPEFARPDGSAIPATAPALSGNLEDLAERHARIDHWTLTPDWYGDRLDPGPILDALLPKRLKAAAA